MTLLQSITDAFLSASKRGEMPTSMGTAELRAMGADVLARSVFTARGTKAIYVSKIKEVIDKLAAGDISEGQARTALYETLDALGYDAEKGGFPGEEVEPAMKGSLQDLRSFRRMDLIVRTQLDLMQGAGLQLRGMTPDRLRAFPAWELVRVSDVAVPRDWPSRWTIAGGKRYLPDPSTETADMIARVQKEFYAHKNLGASTGMIALKGDPIWGELGSYDNFQDALGVDHPPFAFNSGMGWDEISAADCQALGITGPDGETPDQWLESGPVTMAGRQPMPAPQISLAGVDPEIIKSFAKSTGATPVPDKVDTWVARVQAERAARDEAEKQAAIAAMPKPERTVQ